MNLDNEITGSIPNCFILLVFQGYKKYIVLWLSISICPHLSKGETAYKLWNQWRLEEDHTVLYSACGVLLVILLVRPFYTLSFWVYIYENLYLIQSGRKQPYGCNQIEYPLQFESFVMLIMPHFQLSRIFSAFMLERLKCRINTHGFSHIEIKRITSVQCE